MASAPEQRNYNMSDAELCMFTSNLCNFLVRDLSDMSPFGITTSKIAELKGLGDSFEVFPVDDVYVGQVMIETQAKNEKLELVRDTIRDMALRVEMKWGENSGQYKTLSVVGLIQFSEDKTLLTARNVHVRMTGYLPDLTDQGLTQDMLDDFEVLNEDLEVLRNSQMTKVALRDMKAKERIDNGNALYKLVVTYCEIGKRVYDNDAAKYDDYVIYKTPQELPGKVLNLSYDVASGVMSWDTPQSSDPIDKYELERSADESAWTRIYEGAANQAPAPLLSGDNYFRCRAHNKKGWGVWSDNFELNVGGIPAPSWLTAVYYPAPFPIPTPPPKILPEHVLLEWENVAEATKYEVWRSVVNVGAPAGEFTILDEHDSELYHDFAVTLNKRNYYYIVANNSSDRSEPSVGAWAETVE